MIRARALDPSEELVLFVAPVEAEVETKTAMRRRWSGGLIGGSALAAVIFLFLAWIQPVGMENQKVELPATIQFKLRPQTAEAPPPQKQQQEKPKKTQPRKRAKPKQRRKSISPRPAQRPARSSTTSVAPRTGQSRSFAGIDLGFGGGGGGPAISVDVQMDDMATATEVLAARSYQKNRERIRQQREGLERQNRPKAARTGGRARSAKIDNFQKPAYPYSARKQNLNGWVKLSLLVGVDGSIEEYEILAADPPNTFEEATINTLGNWTFRAAADAEGRPIEEWVEYTVEFNMEDQ